MIYSPKQPRLAEFPTHAGAIRTAADPEATAMWLRRTVKV